MVENTCLYHNSSVNPDRLRDWKHAGVGEITLRLCSRHQAAQYDKVVNEVLPTVLAS